MTQIALCALVATMMLASSAVAQDYRVVKERDSSFGNVRARVILEIEVPGEASRLPADPIAEATIQTMMRAALDRYQADLWPDAISVRLWASYERDSVIQNKIVYAPDGCGWAGTDCTGEVWTDLDNGDMPETDEEAVSEVPCEKDIQCWGEQHLVNANVRCARLMELSAVYDYEWTDGFFETKFDRWRWADRKAGTLQYTGDKIKLQNAYGAWMHFAYWCVFDPATDMALDLEAIPR